MDPSTPCISGVSFRQMAYSWDPELDKPHPEQYQSLDQSIMSLDLRPIEDWTTKEITKAFFDRVTIDGVDRYSYERTFVSNFVKDVPFRQLLDEEKPLRSRHCAWVDDRTCVEETSTSSRSTKAPLTASGLLRFLRSVCYLFYMKRFIQLTCPHSRVILRIVERWE
jgi:hypothetical protein